MRTFLIRARTPIPFVAAASLALAGVALANSPGSPWASGTANAGTADGVTLIATVHGRLHPGASAPLTLSAQNPGSSGVYVSSVHLVSVSADPGHSGCDTTAFSMTDVPENTEVPPGAVGYRLPKDGRLVFGDSGANQDTCQGANLTLSFSAN